MHYTLHIVDWHTHRTALAEIRRRVFIEEQQVPEELEWDEHDAQCRHILVCDEQNRPIACGRMKPDGHIGRMAVLPQWRKQGIGSAVITALLKLAQQQQLPRVYLHAQTSATGFYRKHGFAVCSDEFMDAGIPHRSMQKTLET